MIMFVPCVDLLLHILQSGSSKIKLQIRRRPFLGLQLRFARTILRSMAYKLFSARPKSKFFKNLTTQAS